jgi:heterodisulfide reductase subunit A
VKKVQEELLPKEEIAQLCKKLGDGHFADVMVVGGGISGIQASLDLASAGFKVYLVEKSPAIGGHMAQLDKTFPTNDCSM